MAGEFDWLSLFNTPAATAGGTALSAGGDIFGLIQNLQRQNAIRNVYQILADPTKLSQYAQGLASPQALQALFRQSGADWSTLTGGAQGGANAQYFSDALAKYYMDLIGQGRGALGQAGQAAGSLPQYGGGQFGGILNALKILQGIKGGQGGSPGLVSGFPMAGGSGFAGGSEGFRGDYQPAQSPVGDTGGIAFNAGVE